MGSEMCIRDSNDNVFYSEQDLQDDSIFHIRPRGILKSTWSRHQFSVDFQGDFADHKKLGNEDYEDVVLALEGRIDIKRRTFLGLTAVKTRLHEARTSPDNTAGIAPNKFRYDNYKVSFEHTFNRLKMILSVDQSALDYKNNLCLLYTSPSPRDLSTSRMPSSA